MAGLRQTDRPGPQAQGDVGWDCVSFWSLQAGLAPALLCSSALRDPLERGGQLTGTRSRCGPYATAIPSSLPSRLPTPLLPRLAVSLQGSQAHCQPTLSLWHRTPGPSPHPGS